MAPLTPQDFEVPSGDQPIQLFSDRLPSPGEPIAVLLPLDAFVDVRIAALQRLVAELRRAERVPRPTPLPPARRRRLVAALRALDGRLDGASYREIADVLFGPSPISDREWKTHDLRDRTIRLARYGYALMRGGYRQLLAYPYRGRLPASRPKKGRAGGAAE